MPRRKKVPLSEVVAELIKVSTPTLEQYSERSGIGYSTLRDWQRNPRAPRSENITRLVDAARKQRDEIDRLLKQLPLSRP